MYYSPSGLISSIHDDKNYLKQKYDMYLFDESQHSPGLSKVIEQYQSGDYIEGSVTIQTPHVTVYEEMFKSWHWRSTIQLLLPLFGLYVALVGLFEIHRLVRSKGLVAINYAEFWVCVFEALCIMAFATALALGTYGRNEMSYEFHYFFFFALNGTSLFVTVLMALSMREQSRKYIINMPAQDIWKTHKAKISVAGVLFMGMDIFSGILTGVVPVQASGVMMVLIMLTFSVGQGAVGIFFMCQARAFQKPLHDYVQHPESNPDPSILNKVHRLEFWLNTAGCSMLVNCWTILFPAAASAGVIVPKTAYPWLVGIFVLALSRMVTALAHIKLYTPVSSDPSFNCSPAVFCVVVLELIRGQSHRAVMPRESFAKKSSSSSKQPSSVQLSRLFRDLKNEESKESLP